MPTEAGRGPFVVVVAPDGAGKTTLARGLLDRYPGPTAYFHFRPPVFASLDERPRTSSIPPPKRRRDRGFPPLGWARLGWSFLRCWAAHLARVRPALANGKLVVGDRWTYGYLAQPRALKYYGPKWLASLMIRGLPRPDLVVNLHAEPDVIRSRKHELTRDEIAAELEAWARLPVPNLVTLDAAEEPDSLAGRVFAELSSRSFRVLS